MATYCVFESTNMASTHYAERIFDCVCAEDVENGTFGYIEELAEGESHIYKFVKGTKEGCKVIVVDQPAWTEDTSRMINQRKDKFIVEAGVPFRGRVVKVNDEMALSAEGFSGEPDVDKYVSINANGKLLVGNSPVTDSVMVGKIMRKRKMGSTLITSVRDYGYTRMMYEVKVESLA